MQGVTTIENAQKQFEEGEELTNCVVGEAGVITTRPVRSHLVWAEGKNIILDLYQPNVGTEFVEIAFGKENCGVLNNLKLKMTGAVLGWVPLIDGEAQQAVTAGLGFDTHSMKMEKSFSGS